MTGARSLSMRAGRLLVFTLAVSVMLASTPSLAAASPLSNRLDQAQEVREQIDEIDRQVALAAEDYNAANEEHRELVLKTRELETELAEVESNVTRLRKRLGDRAVAMYQNGPAAFVELLLGAASFEEVVTTWDLLTAISARDARDTAELEDALAELTEKRTVLQRQRDRAAEVAAQMEEEKRSIESRLAERENVLAGLEDEIAALEREEEERARARREAAATAAGGPPETERGSAPSPAGAARSEVVRIAMRYLGTPYRWGAEGPDAFDCSGFTQYVYRQVGIELPRVSRAQISAGTRVSRAELRPGDLVFFGTPIHHVGIYVGNGEMIHSPRTGDVVKISPLSNWDCYVGATRP
jgi:cell wall-associated NlpC family hydrolase